MIRAQLIPAVAYYRMSTDRQDKSIAEQRTAVEEYARANGFQIVRDYKDEGISGDATEKRFGFQTMIADAGQRHDFQAILAWDQDRIGRFNSMEAGYWLHPLVKLGVYLSTVAQGRIDWNDFAGRVMYAIQQEGKNQFLRDLARNSLRGLITRAKTGQWVGGPPPFAFVVGDDGYLAFGDRTHIAAVREVFKLRLLGMGYRTIAHELNRRAIISPSGGKWSHDAVRIVLGREAYAGISTFGGRKQGKYFTTNDEQVTAVATGRKQKTTPVRVEKAHPAIVDRKTFDAAQAMRSSQPKPHRRQGSEGAPLAGLLCCGRCGATMYAQSLQRKAGQKFPNYICATYHKGRGCGYCAVPQSALLTAVANVIRDKVLMGSLEALELAIAAELGRRAVISRTPDEATPKRLAELDRKIENATERLVSVDASLVPSVEKKLMAMRAERELLRATTKPAKRTKSELDPKRIAARIWELEAILERGSPAKVRLALGQIVSRIRLDFTPGKTTGRGQRFDFAKGTIELHTKQLVPPVTCR